MGLLVLPHTITAGNTALASEVQENFDAIKDVLNGSIEAANIATGAVTATKLGTAAVTEAKIDTGAVTATKIGTGAVTETKLGTSAVTAAKLASSAVTSTKIDTGAVTTAKLADSAVTSDKLATSGIEAVVQTLVPQSDTAKIYLVWYVLGLGGVILPSGWSVSVLGTGEVRVTHNLNSSTYLVFPSSFRGNQHHSAYVSASATTTFTVKTYFESAGELAIADADFAALVVVL